jgi:hypothetical protein
MSKFPRAALAASLLAASVAGCSGGGLGLSNEVIVRNDTDPYNLDAAQRIADGQCAARGAGRAQFVLLQNNPRSGGGQAGGSAGGPPDIIYRCLPAGGAR